VGTNQAKDRVALAGSVTNGNKKEVWITAEGAEKRQTQRGGSWGKFKMAGREGVRLLRPGKEKSIVKQEPEVVEKAA